MNFEKGQIWTSKENPERDIIIVDIWYETCCDGEKETKNNMRIEWKIHNDKEWDKYVCEKLKYNSINEVIKNRECGTYPHAFMGDKSYWNMKQYIKKYNMELMEVNQ